MPSFLHGIYPTQLSVLSGLVFFAGIVDALAGGGGLITVPAYLSIGLHPGLVLGTNKVASAVGTAVAAGKYQQHQRIPLRTFSLAIVASWIGSYVGARLTGLYDPRWLKYIVVIVMPFLTYAIYSHHSFGRTDRSRQIDRTELIEREISVAFPLGCYDGFFGPGTGTFLSLGLSGVCGYDLLGSTARAKILNLVSNVSAAIAFLIAGRVHIGLGVTMGLISIAGNYVGSHLGVRRGAAIIRPAIILVCGGLFIKILIDIFS